MLKQVQHDTKKNVITQNGQSESTINILIIHSTKAMKIAWSMYETLGFERSEDLDFKQAELQVFGFRFIL
jgi:hypothetical protein